MACRRHWPPAAADDRRDPGDCGGTSWPVPVDRSIGRVVQSPGYGDCDFSRQDEYDIALYSRDRFDFIHDVLGHGRRGLAARGRWLGSLPDRVRPPDERATAADTGRPAKGAPGSRGSTRRGSIDLLGHCRRRMGEGRLREPKRTAGMDAPGPCEVVRKGNLDRAALVIGVVEGIPSEPPVGPGGNADRGRAIEVLVRKCSRWRRWSD